ncbi:DUF123 domain-containing protein [Rhodospira trueperi]|uniref:Uri superfamily endonuclease n=1 Tax=Rhodospira trueperi TaxID=69960 RepID=A0A1G6XR33_9PROT|nr:DUF123 domain-containing protein [Rhodospira trueperi]SDD79776.1 Uri superfamily endonuclease [Rhodospira trueperi]
MTDHAAFVVLPDMLTQAWDPWLDPREIETEAPTGPGAYLLALRLVSATALPPRLSRPDLTALTPGWYLYAGSARGPGGLRARVRRHARANKARRWHVDWLTCTADVLQGVFVQPGGHECALIAEARARLAVAVPVPGFGASDCRRCPAHLVEFDDAEI